MANIILEKNDVINLINCVCFKLGISRNITKIDEVDVKLIKECYEKICKSTFTDYNLDDGSIIKKILDDLSLSLGVSLAHIEPNLVVSKDKIAVQNLFEVFSEVISIDVMSEQEKTSVTENDILHLLNFIFDALNMDRKVSSISEVNSWLFKSIFKRLKPSSIAAIPFKDGDEEGNYDALLKNISNVIEVLLNNINIPQLANNDPNMVWKLIEIIVGIREGFLTTNKILEMIKFEEEIIKLANEVLVLYQLESFVKEMYEVNEELFAKLLESYLGGRMEKVVRSPTTEEEQARNMRQTLAILSDDVLQTPLNHISPHDVVMGNCVSIKYLLEIFRDLTMCKDYTDSFVSRGDETKISHKSAAEDRMSHKSEARDRISHKSVADEKMSHKSEARDRISHKSEARDLISHESVFEDKISHKSEAGDRISHKSFAKDEISKKSEARDIISYESVAEDIISHKSEAKDKISHKSEARDKISHKSEAKDKISHKSEAKDKISFKPVAEEKKKSSRGACQCKGGLEYIDRTELMFPTIEEVMKKFGPKRDLKYSDRKTSERMRKESRGCMNRKISSSPFSFEKSSRKYDAMAEDSDVEDDVEILRKSINKVDLDDYADDTVRPYKEAVSERLQKEFRKSNEINKMMGRTMKGVDLEMPPGYERPGYCEDILKKCKIGQNKGSESNRDKYMKCVAGKLMSYLLQEYPSMEIPKDVKQRICKSFFDKEDLDCIRTKRSQTRRRNNLFQAQEKERQKLDLLKKDIIVHDRLKNLREKKSQQSRAKAVIRNRKILSNQMRKHCEGVRAAQKARDARKKSCHYQELQKICKEKLSLRRDALADERREKKEKRQEEARRQVLELESIENYYRDQFAMLNEDIEKERTIKSRRDKEQAKLMREMKLEMRKNMEEEIEQLQDKLCGSKKQIGMKHNKKLIC